MSSTSAASPLLIECARPDCYWKGSPTEAASHPCPVAPAEPEDPDAAGSIGPEPTTREEIEAWLIDHGDYDDDGVPQDERTATLDARLAAFEASEPGPDLDELQPIDEVAPAEPELQPRELAEGETLQEATDLPASVGDRVDPPLPPIEPRAMETVVAEALNGQALHPGNRWVVVREQKGQEAQLLARGRTRKEAKELLDAVTHGQPWAGEVAIYKTADVLADAEGIEVETKRELVEPEPDLETPATPEPEPEPELPPAAEAKTGEQATLMDADAYLREGLAIPKIDGQAIDRIAVAFSGRILLDRSDEHDVALFNGLRLGGEVELRVAGKVNGTGAKGATDREGDLDVVIGEKTIKVSTVYVLAPTDL